MVDGGGTRAKHARSPMSLRPPLAGGFRALQPRSRVAATSILLPTTTAPATTAVRTPTVRGGPFTSGSRAALSTTTTSNAGTGGGAPPAAATTRKPPPPPPPPGRWVSDVRARVGRCVGFGCDAGQAARAAGVLGVLARGWRELAAGGDGFLTGPGRGLEGQQVVWGEMDSFGHVNNVNYIRYAESARVNWIRHFAIQDPEHQDAWRDLMMPKTIGLIMQSIKADYKFPMTAPDTISVYQRLRAPPGPTDTALLLECVVLSHNHRRIAARTTEEIAIYDYREARKAVLPGFMIDVFRDTWRRQEERAEEARRSIWGLLDEVRSLERETWDRADAVEDFGAAAGKGK
ncbi:putative thioesterase thiol ester dehydrase-isomerase protein [Rosellinia necatrix]|uniref:Putative thioesterase thiol ester dehydrase-isomerase protein n=1 Tax=Rosellinia necatrix TaxID=77044 RepID=A0A1S7UL16_ROSNE|nr:putative thioesterase thiol ester dehydrase-isomerase protein [Rosellinia necatrix]